MKILLINPSYMNSIPEDVYFSVTGFTVPHLGLGYIASYLEQYGHVVQLVECMAQQIYLQQIYQMIESEQYDVIGISTNDGNTMDSFKIINFIEKKKIKVFVCMGGYTATLAHLSVLNSCKRLNCCILGEGEVTMLELVNALENHNDYRKVSGIAYLMENGKEFITAKQTLIDNIDCLPFPKRVFYSARGEATIVSSRGCMNDCLYCAISSFYRTNSGKKFRHRSAENIFEEILYILDERPDTKVIGFYDDNFLSAVPSNKERIRTLCRLIEKEGIRISYEITACADDICKNIELLKEFQQVGLKRVFVGIESFVERQLKYYCKHATVSDNKNALDILYHHGLEASIGFIPMDPFVTMDELKSNYSAMKNPKILGLIGDYIQPFSKSTALIAITNTRFRREIEQKGLFVRNERGYRFVYENVELFYNIKSTWESEIDEIVKLFYLVLVAKDQDSPLYDTIRDAQMEFINLDLDFLLELCDRINSGMLDIDEYNSFVIIWKNKLHPIHKVFHNAKNLLKEVIEREYTRF